MTVVDVIGGVLGGCCQVTVTVALSEPLHALVALTGQDGTPIIIIR